MTSFSATRYKVGVAAAASVITTIGLVAVPEQAGATSFRADVAVVQLDAVLAAEVSALALSAPETDSATTSAISAAAQAAASGIGETLTNIGRMVLDAIGFVIAPIWWLAMPVTYGIYLDTRRRQSPGSYYIGTVFDVGGWLFAPFNLGTVFFGRAGSSPAESSPSSARSAEAVTPADTHIVEAVTAESPEALRPTSTAESPARPRARAKVSVPRAKATPPLSAAASEHSDETATVPDTETPSAGRGKANTPKAEAQRPNRPEMTKAGPRH